MDLSKFLFIGAEKPCENDWLKYIAKIQATFEDVSYIALYYDTPTGMWYIRFVSFVRDY